MKQKPCIKLIFMYNVFYTYICVYIYIHTILVFILKNTVTSLGINTGEGREEHKMLIPFDPVISLLGMQPQEIYSTEEISFMCKDVHCHIVYDREKTNGLAKGGEFVNYCTFMQENITGH